MVLKTKFCLDFLAGKPDFYPKLLGTTLIKYVANAIPTYIMSYFLLPKSFCHKKFWWGFPQSKKLNLSLLTWDNICKHKPLGGLSPRSMEFHNKSLLARLGWKMITNQPLLWVESLKGKYLSKDHTFLNTSSYFRSSWLWKCMLKNRKVVEKGACFDISNGQNINIWTFPWIPSIPSFKLSPNPNLVNLPDYHVVDMINPLDRSLNSYMLNDLFDTPLRSSNNFRIFIFHRLALKIDGFGLHFLGNFLLNLPMKLLPKIMPATFLQCRLKIGTAFGA